MQISISKLFLTFILIVTSCKQRTFNKETEVKNVAGAKAEEFTVVQNNGQWQMRFRQADTISVSLLSTLAKDENLCDAGCVTTFVTIIDESDVKLRADIAPYLLKISANPPTTRIAVMHTSRPPIDQMAKYFNAAFPDLGICNLKCQVELLWSQEITKSKCYPKNPDIPPYRCPTDLFFNGIKVVEPAAPTTPVAPSPIR